MGVSFEFGQRMKTKIMIVDCPNNNSPDITRIANCDLV